MPKRERGTERKGEKGAGSRRRKRGPAGSAYAQLCAGDVCPPLRSVFSFVVGGVAAVRRRRRCRRRRRRRRGSCRRRARPCAL
eukprot:4428766-Pleurochrysis_carterae.AAC.3